MPKILCDPKKNMLLAVQQLLSQGGYSAVTIRAVAQGCGVGLGTVYNYFPSKEALVAEYLLEDWRLCIAAIEAAASARDAETIAQCIHQQLLHYARSHEKVFRDKGAKGAFAGSFSQYHSMLRSQLAQPLIPYCQHDFAAQFLAEALLTWTLAGKEFHEIWDLLRPLIQ